MYCARSQAASAKLYIQKGTGQAKALSMSLLQFSSAQFGAAFCSHESNRVP